MNETMHIEYRCQGPNVARVVVKRACELMQMFQSIMPGVAVAQWPRFDAPHCLELGVETARKVNLTSEEKIIHFGDSETANRNNLI